MKIPDIMSLNNPNNSKAVDAGQTFLDEMFQFELEDVEELQELNEDGEEIKETDVFDVVIERKDERENQEDGEKEEDKVEDEPIHIISSDELKLSVKASENKEASITVKPIEKTDASEQIKNNDFLLNKDLKEMKALKEIMKIVTQKDLKSENQLEKHIEKIEIKITRNSLDRTNISVEAISSIESSEKGKRINNMEITSERLESATPRQMEGKEIGTKEMKMDIGTVKEKLMSAISELTSEKAEVKVKNNEIKININLGENAKMTIKTTEQNGEIKIEIKSDIRLDNDMKKDLQEMVLDMSEEKELKIELSIDDEGAENEEERTNEQKEKKKKRIQPKEGEFEKMMEGDEKNE